MTLSRGVRTLLAWFLIVASLSLSGHTESLATEAPLEEIQALQTAAQGEVVQIPALLKLRRAAPRLALSFAAKTNVQFLFSDKPEYFPGNGVALREQVQPGIVRLYVYHVPEPSGEKKNIAATVQNPGTNLLTLKFLRRGVPAIGMDYQRMAREALYDFLSASNLPPDVTIPPGREVSLDSRLDQFVPLKNELVHGFYEFQLDQPAQISVFQKNAGQPALVSTGLPLLRRDDAGSGKFGGAGRGLFSAAEFEVTTSEGAVLDVTNGPCQLIVADGKTDPWIIGHDSIDDLPEHDAGNYGVIYHIRLARRSSEPRALALVLCKAGGSSRYCSRLAAALQVSKGAFPGGTINLPSHQPSFGQAGEAVLVQRFPPLEPGKTEIIELTYSPPGAACIPTPFLFVPLPP